MNRVFISLRSLVPKKVGKVTVSLQNGTIMVMVLQPHICIYVGKHVVIMLSQAN